MDQAHYDLCVANGCTPTLAELLACRSPPGVKTDTRRAIGRKAIADEHGWQTADMIRQAQKHGFTPGYMQTYNPMLADERGPGDPLAWCHPHEIRSHSKRVCAKRNRTLLDDNGKVLVRRAKPDKDPMENCVKLSDSIVNDKLALMAKQHPEIKKAPVKELVKLRREIVERHGSKG